MMNKIQTIIQCAFICDRKDTIMFSSIKPKMCVRKSILVLSNSYKHSSLSFLRVKENHISATLIFELHLIDDKISIILFYELLNQTQTVLSALIWLKIRLNQSYLFTNKIHSVEVFISWNRSPTTYYYLSCGLGPQTM